MDVETLRRKLAPLNGKDYGAYQALKGEYDYPDFRLCIDQIPKDPYAPPHTGIYRIILPRHRETFFQFDVASHLQNIVIADFFSRQFFVASQNISKGQRGTGNSGVITINQPGQAVLERNCVVLSEEHIEVRCFLGLPAKGRRVDAKTAEKMLLNELPNIVAACFDSANVDPIKFQRHIHTAEDAEYLRGQLDALGLIAFVANGAILPRASGTSDKPLPLEKAQAFRAPIDKTTTIQLPHTGRIDGLGIEKGVTLIVGGGYHGKSTLLAVLEAGIYNHIPGDGREYCVSHPQMVKLRAYSGRSVSSTDISPFINHLPFEKNTTAFSTENASGSTSQATNIIEAIEVGAQVLLMDEDTCATNFMIRDEKMQRLVAKKDEPITTYIDRVRQLYLENGISTVLVLGGVGDYFEVADHIIQMIEYEPRDVTLAAKEIAQSSSVQRKREGDESTVQIRDRRPLGASVNPKNAHGKFSVFAKEVHRLNFGGEAIDLTDLEQLVELSQTKAIGFAMDYAKQYMDGHNTLRQVVERVVADIESDSLDIINDRISGHFAVFRPLELALAINRLRGLEVDID